MLREAGLLLRAHASSVAVLLAVLTLAGFATLVVVPIPGRDIKLAGVVTDVGPLNAGKGGTNQRAAVRTADGQNYIVEVADYPTCRIGSHVIVHRRPTLIGTRVSIWPDGCR